MLATLAGLGQHMYHDARAFVPTCFQRPMHHTERNTTQQK
eukprot:CAMPEP_0182550586 /NCGR_PEP_ID=MMETSP1323-20130603/41956_1 /TAXON_ID=236787 /ORGANISM="Florenciella parvula, Strain RCC1693" /LENGTH=39 /DNA_ID= /DNA_START= /DNA_END= /DNA_ORIENTATION=